MRRRFLALATTGTLMALPFTAMAATSSAQGVEKAAAVHATTAHAAPKYVTVEGSYTGITVSVGAHVRKGPATPYPIVKTLPGNHTVQLTGLAQGQRVGGTDVWYFDKADNGWISFSALRWVSYPGTLVKSGSHGPFVEEVQFQLNQLGYNCGSVDGVFGTKTLHAVQAFQKAHHLTVDGVVGPATWGALFKK
jgi:hypothetical protein